jgi:hypothetical protein
VTRDPSLPPRRELSPERLRAREARLLDEIQLQSRRQSSFSLLVPRRTRLLAAAVLLAALVTTPALAFSSTVRQFVGLKTGESVRGPVFEARVTGLKFHGPNRPGTVVTVTFTVEQQGRPPGTGVPKGSSFLVLVTRTNHLAPAYGKDGYYHAAARLGPGGFGGVQIGGFMPSNGPRGLNGGFWILTTLHIPE